MLDGVEEQFLEAETNREFRLFADAQGARLARNPVFSLRGSLDRAGKLARTGPRLRLAHPFLLEKAASLSRSVPAADLMIGINAGDFVEAGRAQDLFDVLVGAADRHFGAAANERLGAQHQRANAERREERNLGEVDNQSLAALRQLVEAGIDLLRALNVESPVENDVSHLVVAFDDFHVHARTVRFYLSDIAHPSTHAS